MSEDLIKREDAKVAVMWGNGLDGSVVDDICEKIDAIPSADSSECVCCEYRIGDACCYSDVDIKEDRPQECINSIRDAFCDDCRGYKPDICEYRGTCNTMRVLDEFERSRR